MAKPLRTSVLTLTILYHPDLHRVGERALLSGLSAGRSVGLSRLMPRFARSNDQVGAPLDEVHISRRPVSLRQHANGAVEIDASGARTRISANGQRVLTSLRLSADDVHSGVLLEVGAQVALWLHRHRPDDRRGESDLGLVGQSDVIQAVREDIRRVAAVDVPVLIRGETGSGKELVAQAIHRGSARSAYPMVSVNLAAMPSSLAAAELFGAVRGAFTGAARNQDGYFRRADRSTLFLDEIGEAPGDIQVMLLRALETGEVFSLGAQRSHRVDVRLIAATDADLEGMMTSGNFRAPLLHRLAGFEIHVPPLRARREDIGLLLMHFLAKDLAEAGEPPRLHQSLHQSGRKPWLPMSLVLRLIRYDWPGNVRQLRNAARQLVISNCGREIAEMPRGLARQLARDNGTGHGALDSESDETPLPPPPESWEVPVPDEPVQPEPSSSSGYRKPRDVTEREVIDCLRAHRWDIKATAAALRLSRTSLYSFIRASDNISTAGDLAAQDIVQCHREVGGDIDAMVDRLRVSRHALRRRVKELGLA